MFILARARSGKKINIVCCGQLLSSRGSSFHGFCVISGRALPCREGGVTLSYKIPFCLSHDVSCHSHPSIWAGLLDLLNFSHNVPWRFCCCIGCPWEVMSKAAHLARAAVEKISINSRSLQLIFSGCRFNEQGNSSKTQGRSFTNLLKSSLHFLSRLKTLWII